MVTVYLGLGSNLGDRAKNILDAVHFLDQRGIRNLRLSSIIETAPVGGPPQGLFFNAVLKAETDIAPEVLLEIIHDIERDMGRVRGVRNGPRIIDIDILLFGDHFCRTPQLTIPHPLMFEREFVMRPLREVFPEIICKVSGKA